MSFNSLHFLIYFPVVTTLYFALPYRFRWALLLAASCYFYMAFIPVFILILGFTIVIDYFAGIIIERSTGQKRRLFLILSLISNIGILFVFKYFNFFNSNVKGLAEALHWNYPIESLSILLPIGLSFHTFQAMSYTIEVYRGAQKAERHFGIYALYVMFYPQLVAGPIERPQNLLHQFYEKHDFDYQRVTDGLKLMAWGFFKKVVIADRLAVAVNLIYNEPTKYSGISLILATYFFAYQIYCDFSGYTDIARGAARVMGFRLMRNFDRPYTSKSVVEFWTRWHISLSTWFKDYLFVPLARWHTASRRTTVGGRAVAPLKSLINRWGRYFDIFVVFLISGLWHGANWTYLIWGLLHASFLVASQATKVYRTRAVQALGLGRAPMLLNALRILVTFNLIAFAWIFFRANSVADAFYIISHLGTGINLQDALSADLATKLGTPRSELLITFGLIFFLEIVQWVNTYRGGIPKILETRPVWFRWSLYYLLLAAILFLGEYQAQQFIYFQF